MSKLLNIFAAAVAAVTCASAVTVGRAHADSGTGPDGAHFDGGMIDLTDSWGDATACAEIAGTVDCYRTEPELLEAHPELGETAAEVGTTFDAAVSSTEPEPLPLASTCSSSLRLYNGTGYSGSALYLTSRYVTVNLSTYGFDNVTSSYRVGGCAASFYSGANLAGSHYPGPTGVWASGASMLSGWNNVVSSVIIY